MPHSTRNRFIPLCKLINLTLAALRCLNDGYKREILWLNLVETTFKGLGVGKELTLLIPVCCSIVDEVSPLSVLCFHIGQEVDNLYLTVKNISNRYLLAVENLPIILLLDTKFTNPPHIYCLFDT